MTGAAKVGVEGAAVKTAGAEGRAVGVTGSTSCERADSSVRAVWKLSTADKNEEASVLEERRRGGDKSSSDKAGTGRCTKVEGAGRVGSDETNNETAADDGADTRGKAVDTARVERDGAATGAAEVAERSAEAAKLNVEVANAAEPRGKTVEAAGGAPGDAGERKTTAESAAAAADVSAGGFE
jgi:hypothetical protein